MRACSLCGTPPLNTSASVPRLTPVKSVCTSRSPSRHGGSSSSRISPRPGATTADAYATAAATAGAIVTLLDGVDGWLARRTHMASTFGERFDMETDALLILVLSVLAWQYDKAGAWLVLAGLLRYLFVAAGWLLP